MNKHNFSKLYSFVRQYLKNLWSIFNMEQKKPASPKKKVATQSIPITDSIPEVKVIEKEIKRDYSKVDGMWNRLKNPRGTIYITDVLEAVSNLEVLEDKVLMLRMWANRQPSNFEQIRGYIECRYHPMVKFALPDSIPPYRVNDAADLGLAESDFLKAIRKVSYFIECPRKIQNQIKRENVFINLLEDLHKAESELFLDMVFKRDNDKYNGVNEEVFRAAFTKVLPPKI